MKKYVAEFLGTFVMVFCGTGAIVINNETNGAVTHIGIAITFGLVIICMIYSLGNISGCHINPAVTIAFFFAGLFNKREMIPYLVSQFVGAILASFILKCMFPDSIYLGATIPSGSPHQSFIMEFILTFILMFVILRVSHGSKEQGMIAALAIGFVVLLEAMFAGPVSGASMNPARSLAPALMSGHTENCWIYLLAPTLGAITSIPFWKYLKDNNQSNENSFIQ